MSRPIIVCAECKREMRHAAHGKCAPCYKRARRATLGITNHGYNGYADGCRCEICKEAKRVYMADRRAKALRFPLAIVIAPEVTHGTRSTFEERGCRCPECVQEQIARGRRWAP